MQVVGETLAVYLEENPSDARKILDDLRKAPSLTESQRQQLDRLSAKARD